MEQTNSNNFIQDRAIAAVAGKTLRIYLSNGLSYYGQIYAYDTYSVVFLPYELKGDQYKREEKTFILYKSSISAIETFNKIEELIDTSPYVNKENATRKAFQQGRQAGIKEVLDKIAAGRRGKVKSVPKKKKKPDTKEKQQQMTPPALTNPDNVDFGFTPNPQLEEIEALPNVDLEIADSEETSIADDLKEEQSQENKMEQEPEAFDQQSIDDEEQQLTEDKELHNDEPTDEENKVSKMMEDMYNYKG